MTEVEDFLERHGDVVSLLVDAKIAERECNESTVHTVEDFRARLAARIAKTIAEQAVDDYQRKLDGRPTSHDIVAAYVEQEKEWI